MRTCTRCGGSWKGREFDTTCSHDFAEPPEPDEIVVRYHGRHLGVGMERRFYAVGAGFQIEHPTEEGAISAWKAEWTRRRDEKRSAERAPDPLPRALPQPFDIGDDVSREGRRYVVTGRNWYGVDPSYDGLSPDDGTSFRGVPHSNLSPWRGIKYPDGTALKLTVTDSSGPDGTDRTFPVTLTSGTHVSPALKSDEQYIFGFNRSCGRMSEK